MKFSTTDHQTWQILFTRQVPNLHKFANQHFLDGFRQLALPEDHIPSLGWLNQKIYPISGWEIIRTPVRYMTDAQWSAAIQHKQFPITNFLRSRAELDFTPEPDVFHDIFGHLAMLMSPELRKIINLFADFYATAGSTQLPAIAQLWWNTMEFSLIREQNSVKAFGAGLMSSFGEIDHTNNKRIAQIPFTLEKAVQKPRAVASFHPSFLVHKSVESLYEQLTQFKLKKNIKYNQYLIKGIYADWNIY